MRAPLALLLPLALLACGGENGAFTPSSGDGTGGTGAGSGTFLITGRSPRPGSAGIPTNATIEITFNLPVDATSLGSGSVDLNGESFGAYSVTGNTVRYTPANDLVPGTSYAVGVSPTLRAANGKLLGPVDVWGFKTAGEAPPQDTLPPLAPRPR